MTDETSQEIADQVAYLLDGRVVYVHRKIEGEGYLVSSVYETDGYFEEPPGQEIDSRKYIVDKVFADEPQFSIHESVTRARAELAALRQEMADIRSHMANFDAMKARVEAERNLLSGLDTILDYLSGKAMYVAVRVGFPTRWRHYEIEEYLLKEGDYTRKSLRMVSIRLNPDWRDIPRNRTLKDLSLVVNEYRDGSGSDSNIRFFANEQEAMRFVCDMTMKECLASWESKKHVEKELVDVLIEHRADVPQEWIDYLAARMVSMVASEVENMTTNLEAKKAALEKKKAEAYRYRARAMNMPVDDEEDVVKEDDEYTEF